MSKQREAFVFEVTETPNFSALCREYGISRKTGYKWVKRHTTGEGLEDQSRRPGTSPNRTPAIVEEQILRVRTENPGWGARTIKQVLENEGIKGIPSSRTVNSILQRNGCISEEESQKRKAYTRFERDASNELWQTDFKGEFRTRDGRNCYPLDILDDHSRFAICISASDTTANVVIPCFQRAFEEYGLPNAVLSDNGAQFAGFRNGCTHFEKWLMCLDVLPVHGRLRHPQTQGKIERFHRSMKDEYLRHHSFEDAAAADRGLREWREKYNYLRPHEALGMRTPGSVYTPSKRRLPPRIIPWEYDGAFHVIKVNSWGYVRFACFQVYLSETLINEYVEFRLAPDESSFWVCYRNYKTAEYSTENGKLLNRTICRL